MNLDVHCEALSYKCCTKSRFEIVCNRQRHSYHEINIDCDDTAVETFYFIEGLFWTFDHYPKI